MARSPIVAVERLILSVRGQRVILAADLAAIYGVETRALNQAVKRTRNDFPPTSRSVCQARRRLHGCVQDHNL